MTTVLYIYLYIYIYIYMMHKFINFSSNSHQFENLIDPDCVIHYTILDNYVI